MRRAHNTAGVYEHALGNTLLGSETVARARARDRYVLFLKKKVSARPTIYGRHCRGRRAAGSARYPWCGATTARAGGRRQLISRPKFVTNDFSGTSEREYINLEVRPGIVVCLVFVRATTRAVH